MNINGLLNAGYEMFSEAVARIHEAQTMEHSNISYRIYEGYGDANYKWELQFEKAIDFGNGNYKSFTFKTDTELGKFLFDCTANEGLPKGAKGVLS